MAIKISMSVASRRTIPLCWITCIFLLLEACSTAPRRGIESKGLASWYGKKFHKKRTASGELYNMYALTAAHRTLPFGSKVRVENLRSHHSIVVRVNDRGPYSGHRIIDVSFAAAKALGMISIGTVPVELEIIRN